MIDRIISFLIVITLTLIGDYFVDDYLKKQEIIHVVSVDKIVSLKIKGFEADIKSGKINNKKYINNELLIFKARITKELTIMSSKLEKPIYFKKAVFYKNTKDLTNILLQNLRAKKYI